MSMPEPIREPQAFGQRLRGALPDRRRRAPEPRAVRVAQSIGHSALMSVLATVGGLGLVPAAALMLTLLLAVQGVVRLRHAQAARRERQDPFGR